MLAYTQYGAAVLGRVLAADHPVHHLPHGIDATIWKPSMTEPQHTRALDLLGPYAQQAQALIGCVATNQARKDLGLVFAAMRILREDLQVKAHLWLHIDQQIGEAWSVPQLHEDYRLGQALSVTQDLRDEELAALYALCKVTVAPGRGEGFGYPILESQYCGTPVLHVDYAGGAEFVRGPDRLYTDHLRPEGSYNILRPVLEPSPLAYRLAAHIHGDLRWPGMNDAAQACEWTTLWPRWRAWIQEGLDHV